MVDAPAVSVHRPGGLDVDVARGEHTFDGDLDGSPKWLRFGCRRAAWECAIALAPQKSSNGSSWQWDGNRDRPTINPSVDCGKVAGCGWHGWIRDGVWTP